MKKIIFLDRDGIINKKPAKADYVKSWGEFQLLPHALEALKYLEKNGFQIFIITNQAGIARGLMSEKDLENIHKHMQEIFKKNNIHVTKIYYCPHGWDEGCDCRKPKPGMLFQAAKEYDFDLKQAIFIGDDARDKEAGETAGCRVILMKPDGDLLKIVKTIINV
ncbi:MAG TPA: HAD family hydrolase [Patescibacteria group bacterium]|nr:HAD family hydrolase [Patescibacteria group bacterium]